MHLRFTPLVLALAAAALAQISAPAIYVYDLPPRFNTEPMECVQAHGRVSFHTGHDNFGFGPLTEPAGAPLRPHMAHSSTYVREELLAGRVAARNASYRSLYQTDQFGLEVIMHNKALNSPLRVMDPEEATLFYVPYYVYFVQRCNVPTSAKSLNALEDELFRILKHDYPYWNRTEGRDHIMALSFIEREHTQVCPWCSALLMREETRNMHFFCIEREAKKSVPVSNVINVPYPSPVHFHALPPTNPVSLDTGPILASCVASNQELPFRILLENALNRYAPRGLWLSPERGPDNQGATNTMVAVLENSVFCLQPYGDSPTRKSFYDALLLGCIPVRFLPNIKYPFDDRIDYDTISLYIPEQRLMAGEVDLIDELSHIPQARISEIRSNMYKASIHLQYSIIGSEAERQGRDAFVLAIDEAMHDIYGQWPSPAHTRGHDEL